MFSVVPSIKLIDFFNSKKIVFDPQTDLNESKEILCVSSESSEKCLKSKTSLTTKEPLSNEQEDRTNQRFCLRKRRNINYNFSTKKFEYDGVGDDSEYEEKPKKKNKRFYFDFFIFRFKKNLGSEKKSSKDNKLRADADFKECREFQLQGLLGWKNYEKNEEIKKNEAEYFELDDLMSTNFDSYANDLETILIKTPWSKKFDFSKFCKIKFPLSKMKEGLIFVWTEKEFIADVVDFFEEKGIKYVENLVWMMLDEEKHGNQFLIFSK